MVRIDSKQLQTHIHQWFPAAIIVLFMIFVPPVGFAVILAFFTAPLANSVISIVKLPAFAVSLLIMCSVGLLVYAFVFLTINGLIASVRTVEDQLAVILAAVEKQGWNIQLAADHVIQSGHEAVEKLVLFIQKVFQRLFSLFMFLIAYFFTLRESAVNRFWFLVYFPKAQRPAVKRIFSRASQLMSSFFSVQIRLFLITFTIMSAGFWVLRFDSFLTKAFLISLVDSIPFLGIGIVFLPLIVFSFYIEKAALAAGLLILYIILLITRQFAESYFWAHTFKLRTVHSFIITACAVYLFGLYGIIFLPFFLFLALKIRQHSAFT